MKLTNEDYELIQALENTGHGDLLDRHFNKIFDTQAAHVETVRLLDQYLNNLFNGLEIL